MDYSQLAASSAAQEELWRAQQNPVSGGFTLPGVLQDLLLCLGCLLSYRHHDCSSLFPGWYFASVPIDFIGVYIAIILNSTLKNGVVKLSVIPHRALHERSRIALHSTWGIAPHGDLLPSCYPMLTPTFIYRTLPHQIEEFPWIKIWVNWEICLTVSKVQNWILGSYC